MSAVLDVNALPITERLRLMESPWDSLCAFQSESAVVPAWHGEVVA